MSDQQTNHRFRLEIITPGDKTSEEATRRLRALLKCLLRSFGFRYTSCEPLPNPEPEDDDQ